MRSAEREAFLILVAVLSLAGSAGSLRAQTHAGPSASGAQVLLWGRSPSSFSPADEPTRGASGLLPVADDALSAGCMLRSGLLGGLAGAVVGVVVASDGGDSGDAILAGLVGFAVAGAASTGLSTLWCRRAATG